MSMIQTSEKEAHLLMEQQAIKLPNHRRLSIKINKIYLTPTLLGTISL